MFRKCIFISLVLFCMVFFFQLFVTAQQQEFPRNTDLPVIGHNDPVKYRKANNAHGGPGILDYFTLLDGKEFSFDAFKKAWKILNDKYNFDFSMPTIEKFSSRIGLPWYEFFKMLLPSKYHHLSQKMHSEIAKHELSALNNGMGRLFPGIVEMLSVLKKRHYPMFVTSNASTEYFQTCVRNMNYDEYFRGCYCVGETRKHKGEILRDVMHEHGFRHGVIIGDRKNDIEAGKFNDLLTVGVTYGYGKPEELADADLIINNPDDIIYVF